MNSLRSLWLVVVAISATLAARAQDASDPVGIFRIKLRGYSDTIVSLPLQRAPVAETSLASRTSNTLTLAADLEAFPAEGAFVLVMSGALEGAVLPVTSASGRALTVEAGAFDLAPLKTVATDGAAADLVDVVPYWTLDTLFPAGAGVNASTSALLVKTQILMYDEARVGKNQASSAAYYYYSGTALQGSGWYRVGAPQAKVGGTVLPPHRYFIVRHDNSPETQLSLMGGVQMSGFRVALATRSATEEQDNLVALPVPVPISLSASRLYESGAFQGSPTPLLIADQVLVFDNSVIGKNKASSAAYYYYTGSGLQGAGWYKVGDPSHRADNTWLLPSEGVIIRKQATPQPLSKQWTAVPEYLR